MNNAPIRILQCVDNMNKAGLETIIMNYYRNIDRNKVQFDFLINKKDIGDYEKEIRSLGGNIYVTPGLGIFKWFKYQRYMKKLFIEHPEYKIIHGQNEILCYPALYAAKKAKLPVRIAHSHNTSVTLDINILVKLLYKKLIKKVATNYAACSKKAGEYLFDNNFKVITNAVDSDKFKFNKKKREILRKKMNLENKFVIGHVGRFHIQKNHNYVLNLFSKYSKINKDAVLLLIGRGNLMPYIKLKAKMLNIYDKIIFMGDITNVNDLYQVMDLFILPSFHEGLPVVGIEAQYACLPCLFSDKITKEVMFNKNVDFLSLKDKKKWINKIIYYEKTLHKKNRNKINNKDYDIKNESNMLIDYYYKLLYTNKKEK